MGRREVMTAHARREMDSHLDSFDKMLSAHPDAIVTALGDDGFRIPLPQRLPLGQHRVLALAPERETMLDVVVPADRIGVVAAWERARTSGIAVTAVHALTDPETRLTLTMIDARQRYGTWMALLTPVESVAGVGTEDLTGPLVVPTRPRQARMHKNMTAVVTDVDDNVVRMFGWGREHLVGSRSSEFIHPDDQERAVSNWMQLLATRDAQRVRFRHRCVDGEWLWIEVENIHNGAEEADEVDVVAHISDISDEMAAYEALRRRERLFSRLAEALPTGVLQIRHDGTVVYANVRLREIVDTTSPTHLEDLLAAVAPGDRAGVQAALQSAFRDGADAQLEVEVGTSDALRSRRCAMTVAAVADEDGRPAALVCLDDITESARLREELRVQATHDVLTDLPNHRALVAAIDDEIERARRSGRPLAVVFLDLDHFKALNDTLGHAAGDRALRETGAVIRASARTIDTVGRWGGEEFVALLPDTDSAAAAAAAERIRSAIARHPYPSVNGAHLTCSIGIAIYPDDGNERDALLARADGAMYIAKQLGRNQAVAANDDAAASLAAGTSDRVEGGG